MTEAISSKQGIVSSFVSHPRNDEAKVRVFVQALTSCNYQIPVFTGITNRKDIYYLQAETLDLGAGIVGAFHDKELIRVMRIPRWHEPLLIMPSGYEREISIESS